MADSSAEKEILEEPISQELAAAAAETENDVMDVSDVPPDTLTSDGADESMEIDLDDTVVEAQSQSQEAPPTSIDLAVAEAIADEEEELIETVSQKSADEVIQTAPVHDNEAEIGEEVEIEEAATSETEEEIHHLSKEENELLSSERLDRESPEIWPQKIPGAQKVYKELTSNADGARDTPAWAEGLTQDDIDEIYKMGDLSRYEVIVEVKKLYDQAYKLGVQEAKEMTRGKYLNIFSNNKKI